MYLYIDENDYVYGYGSENEQGSVQWDEPLPNDVARFLGCYKFNNGDFILDEPRKEYVTYRETCETEYNNINSWFTWYDQQCVQYQRATRLGQEFDKDITELDSQAAEMAKRMKYLKEEMAKPYVE